jgi:hypothetical protein
MPVLALAIGGLVAAVARSCAALGAGLVGRTPVLALAIGGPVAAVAHSCAASVAGLLASDPLGLDKERGAARRFGLLKAPAQNHRLIGSIAREARITVRVTLARSLRAFARRPNRTLHDGRFFIVVPLLAGPLLACKSAELGHLQPQHNGNGGAK